MRQPKAAFKCSKIRSVQAARIQLQKFQRRLIHDLIEPQRLARTSTAGRPSTTSQQAAAPGVVPAPSHVQNESRSLILLPPSTDHVAASSECELPMALHASPTRRLFTSKLFTSDIVQVSVGDPAVVYNLHQELLCERCPYFKGCFDGPFKETEDKKTALKEESPDAFAEKIGWIYSGKVSRPQYGETDDMSLINIYILADRLCMEALKNSIVTTLYHFYASNYVTTTAGITTLAEKGLADCELRSFLLWRLSRDIVESGYQEMLQKIPDLKEYIAAGGDDVVHLFGTTMGRTVDELEILQIDGEDKCRWHEHLMTPACPGARTYGDGRSKKVGTKLQGTA